MKSTLRFIKQVSTKLKLARTVLSFCVLTLVATTNLFAQTTLEFTGGYTSIASFGASPRSGNLTMSEDGINYTFESVGGGDGLITRNTSGDGDAITFTMNPPHSYYSFKRTDGSNFQLDNITIEFNISTTTSATLTGFENGSVVSGATQSISFTQNVIQNVDVSVNSNFDSVDEFRITFSGSTDNNATTILSDVTYSATPAAALDPLQSLYWPNEGNDKIEGISVTGANRQDVVNIAASGSLIAIDIDQVNEKAYWFDQTDLKIYRSNLDGTGIEEFVSDPGYATTIFVDHVNEYLYWPNNGSSKIERIKLDGTGREDVISATDPIGISVDVNGSMVYWYDQTNGSIYRGNLDGTGSEEFISDPGYATTLYIDQKNNYLYWPNDGASKIERIKLDGSGRTDIASATSPTGISVDVNNSKVYWYDGTNGNINRANLDGTASEVFISDPGYATTLSIPWELPSNTPPTVTTTAESGVGATSATLGGEVTADGGAAVTESGIVWGTSSGPDINDNKVAMDSGVSSFSQSVGLLPFGTTIYYRAYATNSEGTAYGDEESFTTGFAVSVNLTGSEGWRMLSVPANVNLSTFLDPIWIQGVTEGGDTDFGTPNVYIWDLAAPDNDHTQYWNAVTNLNATLAPGTGFLVYVYADDNYDNSPDTFPKPLSVSGVEYPSGTSGIMNIMSGGWTLLGNPFGSAIDFDLLTKSNLESTIYIWDPNVTDGDGGTEPNQPTGSWKTYNGTSGDVTGGRIAPFQGFLVENNGAGSVTFTQSGKTTETPATFLGKDNPPAFVRLELEGNGMRNSAWLEFSPDGSTKKTNGDAWELTPLSTNFALLATRKADASLVDIGRYPQSGEMEIPLVAKATWAGKYTLRVTDFESPGQTLYLNDLQRGKSIRLVKDSQYEFTIDQAMKAPANPFAILQKGLKKQVGNSHRFVISSSALENPAEETPEQFSLDQNYPNPFNPVTVIRYQLPVNSQVRLEVFDMAGRQITTLVNSQQNAGTHSVNFDGSNISSGVYMYRLEASGISLTKKLTLIK